MKKIDHSSGTGEGSIKTFYNNLAHASSSSIPFQKEIQAHRQTPPVPKDRKTNCPSSPSRVSNFRISKAIHFFFSFFFADAVEIRGLFLVGGAWRAS